MTSEEYCRKLRRGADEIENCALAGLVGVFIVAPILFFIVMSVDQLFRG